MSHTANRLSPGLPTTLYVSGGMPLILAKLGKPSNGQFIEMVELLSDFQRGLNPSDEDQLKSSKFKNWEITNTVD